MKQAEDLLPSTSFMRIHRSDIVSINANTAFLDNTIEIDHIQLSIGGNYKEPVIKKIQGKE